MPCWDAIDSPATWRRGSMSTPSILSASPARSCASAMLTRPCLRGSRPRKMFSATESSGTMRISWWISATPWSSDSAGLRGANSTPSRVMCPALGWCIPARMALRVDLPAPFSPMSPTTEPAATVKSTLSSTRTPENSLQMPVTARAPVVAVVGWLTGAPLLDETGSGGSRRVRRPAGPGSTTRPGDVDYLTFGP